METVFPLYKPSHHSPLPTMYTRSWNLPMPHSFSRNITHLLPSTSKKTGLLSNHVVENGHAATMLLHRAKGYVFFSASLYCALFSASYPNKPICYRMRWRHSTVWMCWYARWLLFSSEFRPVACALFSLINVHETICASVQWHCKLKEVIARFVVHR